MKLYKIVDFDCHPYITIGWCLSDIDLDDCYLDELLGTKFFHTTHERWVRGDKVKSIKETSCRPTIKIQIYNEPSNYLNRLTYNSLHSIDYMKKICETFLTVKYKNADVYVGLEYWEESHINEKEHSHSYTTWYDFGPTSTNCGVSHEAF